MIGSFLLWTWVWILGTFLTTLALVLSIPFNPWTDPKRTVVGYLSQAWGRGVMWVLPGITIEATGFEHLKPGPVILVPNHSSISDVIMLLAALPQFRFMAKAPLFWIPPLGLHLRLAGQIKAGTGEEGDQGRVLDDCAKQLKVGNHILWFPEGHRSFDGVVKRFKTGAFVAAKQSGVKVVPVAITGTPSVIKNKSLRYYFKGRRVQITLLPGFPVDGEPKAAAGKAREIVAAQVAVQRARE